MRLSLTTAAILLLGLLAGPAGDQHLEVPERLTAPECALVVASLVEEDAPDAFEEWDEASLIELEVAELPAIRRAGARLRCRGDRLPRRAVRCGHHLKHWDAEPLRIEHL